MSSVVLRLDHAEGGEDRIRIDLRGTSVGATFDVRDSAAADQLRAHAPELQAALERRGLDGDGIAVRTMSRTGESTFSLASAASAEREALRAGTGSSGTNTSSRDARTPWRGEREDAPSDQPTSRQRRDQKGQR